MLSNQKISIFMINLDILCIISIKYPKKSYFENSNYFMSYGIFGSFGENGIQTAINKSARIFSNMNINLRRKSINITFLKIFWNTMISSC